ncbi:MAG TPA: FAD-dependent oxidoreductase [Pirellulales bacterium]|nr:FAD-dependent oxidoreductase [Pirellulales bacterium]
MAAWSLIAIIALAPFGAPAAANDRPSGEAWDVVVYGGTSAGVTAAIQAARMRRRVVLVEPGKHLGGMTASGLGATDYGKKSAIGGLAREFYQRVKRYYDGPTAWRYERADAYTSHGHDPAEAEMYYFEPHVAEALFNQMVAEAGVTVVLGEGLDLRSGVQKIGSQIDAIRMESGRTFRGRMFIDCSYEGDMVAGAKVDYTLGREGSTTYQETLAGVQTKRLPYSGHNFFRPVDPYINPGDATSGLLFGVSSDGPGVEGAADHRVQAYCYRICMTDVPENRVAFSEPEGYDPAHYELMLRYLTATGTFPDLPKPKPVEHPALGYRPRIKIMPNQKTDTNSKGAISSNLVGGNYQYPETDHAVRRCIALEHERWHRGMLWFLSTDARVPSEYREALRPWGLAKDEFTDNNHWPWQLYVREARRMIGAYVMVEQNCSGARAADDSVGLGSYHMDSHVTQRYVDSTGAVRNEGTIGGKVPQPYPISYRALLPKSEQCSNLLVPVCLSASHVAYGSIRMEPVYMILGQSAATAACLALDGSVPLHDMKYPQLRERLLADGQILDDPRK